MASIHELATLLNNLEIVDLSPLFHTNMPGWHTHPEVAIIEDSRSYAHSGYFLQTLILPEHSGSHVDAPAHVLPDKADQTIEKVAPTSLFGIAKKIDLAQEQYAPGELVPLSKVQEVLAREELTIEKGDLVIFDFGYDKYLLDLETKKPHEREWWGKNEPGLDEDVCRFLYEAGVRAVGSDTAACDISQINGELKTGYGHIQYFLPNGIFIIEGLYGLNRVPNTFYFMALPLKIKGGSGSPLRPIALF
jgi:kynurenine formamidase